MYEKHESQWTTFEKVFKFIGDICFVGIFIGALIQVITGFLVGQRGILSTLILSMAAIWCLCFLWDSFFDKKYGRKKK